MVLFSTIPNPTSLLNPEFCVVCKNNTRCELDQIHKVEYGYQQYLNFEFNKCNFQFTQKEEIITAWVDEEKRQIHLVFGGKQIILLFSEKVGRGYWCNQYQLLMIEKTLAQYMNINGYIGAPIVYYHFEKETRLSRSSEKSPVYFKFKRLG